MEKPKEKKVRSNLNIKITPVLVKQKITGSNIAMSVTHAQAPLHVDMNTFKSMSGKKLVSDYETDNLENKESRSSSPMSDSGFGQSEQDGDIKTPPQKTDDDSSISSSRAKLSSVSVTSHSESSKNGIEEDKTLVQTQHLDLKVPDKSVTPDLATQRYNERCILSQKQANTDPYSPRQVKTNKLSNQQEQSGNKKGLKRQEMHQCNIISNDAKYESISSKNNAKRTNKKELQWLDLRSNSMEKTLSKERTNISSRPSQNHYRATENEWSLIEKEMKRLKTKGYDPDMAMMALLSTFGNTKTTSRLDWRMLTKSIAETGTASNNDFFSVYPWSMRKKERSSSRLGDYLQQCVQEDQKVDNKKNSKGKRHAGPSGVKFVQSPRGYMKKEKTKTPGEMALDQARHQNSKRYKAGNDENPLPKCKTSASLPSLASASSVSSHNVLEAEDKKIKLPDIPNYRPTANGKIYSGIYRLATPPVIRHRSMQTGSSTPSFHAEIGKESFPLQVKNCGIPNSESLSFTPMLKSYITRSNTDIYNDNYHFPLLVTDRNSSSDSRTSSSQALSVYPISKEQRAKHQVILQTLYARSLKDPPKPPPVTPNVKKGRTLMSEEELDSFMLKYKSMLSKTQTPVCSRRSSYVQGRFSDSEFEDDDHDIGDYYEDNAVAEDEDKSSIHSLSTLRSDNDQKI